jgi:hypothetical protein
MLRIVIAVFTMELLCPCPASASPVAAIVAGASSASAKVKGPIAFELRVIEGDIEVVTGAADTVSVEVKGARGKDRPVTLRSRGKRMTAEFRNKQGLQNGDVRVTLPPGSSVHLQTISGDVSVKGLGGSVEVSAVSGDVKIDGAADVSVEIVSGDLELRGATGDIEIETVSGDAEVVRPAGAKGRFEFETTAGDLDWFGTCARDCRMDIETLSGRATLRLDPKSSFELDFETFAGGLSDKLGVKIVREAKSGPHGGKDLEARYGKGTGKISFESHSGQLVLAKK